MSCVRESRNEHDGYAVVVVEGDQYAVDGVVIGQAVSSIARCFCVEVPELHERWPNYTC